MNKKITYFVIFNLALFFCTVFQMDAISSEAEKSPIEVLKASVNKIIAIIESEEYKNTENQDELTKEIFLLVDGRFSWQEMGKRSLGRKWKEQAKDDQDKFVSLFSKLMKTNYIDKLKNYAGESVSYDKEK